MKNLILLLLSLFLFCSAALAAPQTALYYKVPDVVLQCQNAQEDPVAGRAELEKEIEKIYGKRFDVKSVQPLPPDVTTPSQLGAIPSGVMPFVIDITPAGEGTTVDHYQNAFGAGFDAAVPTVNVHLVEMAGDIADNTFYSYDYGVQSYSAGSFAIGKDVFAKEKNPRKNTKNAIKTMMKAACAQNTSINKYASPKAYAQEAARYEGRFKEMAMEKKIAQAKSNAEIEEFLAWCKTIPGGDQIALGLQGMPNLSLKMEYIKTAKAMFAPQPTN